MLYRIYTENTNYTKILELVKSYFPEGFMILTGEGCSDGKQEHSLTVDVITNDQNRVLDLAYNIKKANKQNSVLVFGCTGEMKIVR